MAPPLGAFHELASDSAPPGVLVERRRRGRLGRSRLLVGLLMNALPLDTAPSVIAVGTLALTVVMIVLAALGSRDARRRAPETKSSGAL